MRKDRADQLNVRIDRKNLSYIRESVFLYNEWGRGDGDARITQSDLIELALTLLKSLRINFKAKPFEEIRKEVLATVRTEASKPPQDR